LEKAEVEEGGVVEIQLSSLLAELLGDLRKYFSEQIAAENV